MGEQYKVRSHWMTVDDVREHCYIIEDNSFVVTKHVHHGDGRYLTFKFESQAEDFAAAMNFGAQLRKGN